MHKLSKDMKKLLTMWAVATIIGIFFILNIHKIFPTMLPPEATHQAHSVDFTLGFFTVLAIPIAMFVWLLAAFMVVKTGSREFPDTEGPAIHGNAKIQTAWLASTALLCVGLVVYGLALLPSVYTPRPGKNLVIDVVGSQWQWAFKYPQYNNIETTTLRLPLNQPVTFDVYSVDVIHSFWVPAFGIKVDANPGEITTAYVQPRVAGTYTVRCAELCGLYHAYMQAPVKVTSSSAFSSWVAAKEKGAA